MQDHLKTENGERAVDLCTCLAAMLKDFIGTRTSGLLFCTSTGRQILQRSVLRDSLHPILKRIGHVKGWVQHFSALSPDAQRNTECPKALEHFWSGHAQDHVSERYKKLLPNGAYRLESAATRAVQKGCLSC